MLSQRHRYILQHSLLVELTVALALTMTSTLSEASSSEGCTDVDDGLSLFAQQLSNLSFSPLHMSEDRESFGHNLAAYCPPMPQASSRLLGLHHMSLCPWTYQEDYDYDRFPHLMVYARCSCGRCASANGVWHACKPLYQSFHVIRRICENGSYRYRFVHESLPIACVCSYRPGRVVG